MTPEITQQMPEIARDFFAWVKGQQFLLALLMLMPLDMAAGLVRAFATKSLSSTISWKGMSRKIMMLLVMSVAIIIEPMLHGFPLVNMCAIAYSVTEILSIAENAAAVGCPMPRALLNALKKLQAMSDDRKESVEPRRTGQQTVHLDIPDKIKVDLRTDAGNPTPLPMKSPASKADGKS